MPIDEAATHAGNHKARMAEEQGRSPGKLTACWLAETKKGLRHAQAFLYGVPC